MTTTWTFGGLAVAMILIVWGVWWLAMRNARGTPPGPQTLLQANAGVYQDQLQELQLEHQAGHLSAADFAAAQVDLETRLLQDVDGLKPAAAPLAPQWLRPTAWALAAFLPILALGLYMVLGQPQALDPMVISEGAPQEHLTPQKIEKMASELRARLKQNPDQVEDWIMLARVERAQDHFDAAAQALATALKLSDDPDLAIERAEILATGHQGDFQGEPWQIIQSVLKTNPNHLGALLLAGSASYAEARYPQALSFWQKASAQVPADSPDRQPLDAALSQVRSKMGLPDPQAKAMAASAIQGQVSLDASARNRVRPDDTVFIYATPPDSRMPLAIVRIKASELPYDFVLDDSKTMNPQVHLSDVPVVVVRARLSHSGQAQAQPDDLNAEVSAIRPGSHGLKLRLK
jgi:cytochrome c-type biogenesis protein CcmH